MAEITFRPSSTQLVLLGLSYYKSCCFQPTGMGMQQERDVDVMEVTMNMEPDNRLDAHNAAIDIEVAGAHLCAMTDLRTGRTCVKPVHHVDTCEFVPKREALRMTEQARC